MERWRVRLARLREEHGCDAAEARIQALRDERDAGCDRSWPVRATDPASLKVKARMAAHSHQVLGALVDDGEETLEWAANVSQLALRPNTADGDVTAPESAGKGFERGRFDDNDREVDWAEWGIGDHDGLADALGSAV